MKSSFATIKTNSKTTMVFVNDRNYVVNNGGKSPRGRGRWAFEFTYTFADGGKEYTQLHFAPNHLTITEAVKWAKDAVRAAVAEFNNDIKIVDISIMG